MAAPPTFDANSLDQAGWGVIFAPNVYQAARWTLEPLLKWRRQQAGDLYREFGGDDGYRVGDSAGSFLSRHGIGLGRVSPERMPYYLLLVGSPADIPYRFQQQLDLNYAVGRLHFDDIIAYQHYAMNVLELESRSPRHERQISLYAPRLPGDAHTATTVEELVVPMVADLQERARGWRISAAIGDEATKERLGAMLNGGDDAALLFAATHAVILPDSHPLFDARHGALVCGDWAGPPNANVIATGVSPGPGMQASFGRDDLDPAGKGAPGRMAILWSSFSAGFGPLELRPNAPQRPSVAPLAQRLLGAPSGGMLAVMGFVDRLLGFSSPRLAAVDRYREAVSRAIWLLLTGARVGLAAQNFDEAYAELSVALSAVHEKRRYGQDIAPAELVGLWAATNDMRNVILLGDPAVRLPAARPVVA